MSEPLKLTGPQKEILMKGIVGAYPDPDNLWILLAVRMEVQVSAIARGDAYKNKVFALIQDFEAEGRIEEFIRVVVADKPNSPFLSPIKKEFADILGEDNTYEKINSSPPKEIIENRTSGGQDGRFKGKDSQRKKILILASNPRKDLDLDEEIRLLRNVVAQSRDRDQIEIVSEPGVRVGDLQGLLLRHEPEIVHFCGHGGGEAGLIFRMEGGGEQWVRAEALAGMFGLNPICSHVKCVLLNACYSETQADAIVQSIDYVVGMSHEIQDNAAIAFSKGFYTGLGYGCSIEDSFEFGKNAIQLEISGSSKKRSAAVSEEQRKLEVSEVVTNTSIPEHLKPILKKKTSFNISSSNPTVSQEKRAEIQLVIDKTLEEEDTNVKKYREQVKQYLSDRWLEDYERDLLDVLRDELGLSPEKANQILEEELAPIDQARQAYEKRLKALIKHYPFSDGVKSELKKFQAQWNLTDREVNKISQPILEQAEIAYQEKLQQQAHTSSILLSARGIDYSELAELLKQQKWKEADELTYKVMLKVANRSSEGWLRVEDTDNFPCEDLRTIDGLWVDNSKGRFGFSVQAKIYTELGGTREYNEKVWRAFGDRIGWRAHGGSWICYKDGTFHLEAPQGHLPTLVGSLTGERGSWVLWGVGCISSLASRLVKSNI
jgi:hypothetical protein